MASLVSQAVRLPNLLTLSRFPLAAAFPLAAPNPHAAVGILGLAGLTDVLDGWLARRSGEPSPLGTMLDPIADKVFALTVIGTLAARGLLPGWGIAALVSRELLELPLVLFDLSRQSRAARAARAALSLPPPPEAAPEAAPAAAPTGAPTARDRGPGRARASRHLRGARRTEALEEATPGAILPGKLATVAQFSAAASALVLPALLEPALVAAGLLGVGAGLAYWHRALRTP